MAIVYNRWFKNKINPDYYHYMVYINSLGKERWVCKNSNTNKEEWDNSYSIDETTAWWWETIVYLTPPMPSNFIGNKSVFKKLNKRKA